MDLHSITWSRKVTDSESYRLNKGEINKPSSEIQKAGEHLINPTITAFSR